MSRSYGRQKGKRFPDGPDCRFCNPKVTLMEYYRKSAQWEKEEWQDELRTQNAEDSCQDKQAEKDDRQYFLGAIAERSDGTYVSAYNGAPPEPCAQHHCEYRLTRKLDVGSTVYLARTLSSGQWGNSRPCMGCQIRMKSCRVKKVYYTIGPGEYACLIL